MQLFQLITPMLDGFPVLYACTGLAALGLLFALLWRVATRRHSFPCPTWLIWLLEHPLAASARVETVLERLNVAPGMHVVDVGCGPGRLTIPIARLVGPHAEVTALDIQPAMLRRARARAEATNLNNIRFVQAAVGSGTLEPLRYDRALLVTVLGEIPDREAALKEIFEALKAGGILSVTEMIYDPHFQRRSTVLRLARQAGFRERAFFGNALAYTVNLVKPPATDT